MEVMNLHDISNSLFSKDELAQIAFDIMLRLKERALFPFHVLHGNLALELDEITDTPDEAARWTRALERMGGHSAFTRAFYELLHDRDEWEFIRDAFGAQKSGRRRRTFKNEILTVGEMAKKYHMEGREVVQRRDAILSRIAEGMADRAERRNRASAPKESAPI